MAREHLRLEDLSDREVLLIVADACGSNGDFADSLDIAARLDVGGEHPRRTVAVRLSWLARWGAVEREHARDPDTGQLRYHRDGKVMHTQRWRLTASGWAVASGEMRKGLTNQLDRVDDGQMLVLTRWLARRNASATARKLSEREWRREMMLRR